MQATCADEIPIRIVRSKFLMNAGLYNIAPFRHNKFIIIFEDIRISCNELGSRNVPDCYAPRYFFCHSILTWLTIYRALVFYPHKI